MSTDKTTIRYPAYCCQSCGAWIGYLGRAFDWLTRPLGFTLHSCKGASHAE